MHERIPPASTSSSTGETTQEGAVEGLGGNIRQQDKLIFAIMEDVPNALFLSEVQVSPTQRAAFFQRLARGDISDETFEELLRSIQLPYTEEGTTPDHLASLDTLESKRQARGIIAFLARDNFAARDSITNADIGTLLDRYPTPSSLESKMQSFFETIEKSNSSEKRKEYESAFRVLVGALYGKRQEYWEQIRLLREEAKRMHPETNVGRAA